MLWLVFVPQQPSGSIGLLLDIFFLFPGKFQMSLLNLLSTIEATGVVIKLVDQDCLLIWCFLVEADSLCSLVQEVLAWSQLVV